MHAYINPYAIKLHIHPAKTVKVANYIVKNNKNWGLTSKMTMRGKINESALNIV